MQMSDGAITAKPNLRTETFAVEQAGIAEFFNELAQRMGDRWSQPDSIHLSSAGWQALGIICYDINHGGVDGTPLDLTPLEREHILQTLSSQDWSRNNSLWVDTVRIGMWVTDNQTGQRRLTITGAGRTITQELIDYLRKITGLDAKLKALDAAASPV
jgi:hypothetical protein